MGAWQRVQGQQLDHLQQGNCRAVLPCKKHTGLKALRPSRDAVLLQDPRKGLTTPKRRRGRAALLYLSVLWLPKIVQPFALPFPCGKAVGIKGQSQLPGFTVVFGTATFCTPSELVSSGLKRLKMFWVVGLFLLPREDQLSSGPVQQAAQIQGTQRSVVRQDVDGGDV